MFLCVFAMFTWLFLRDFIIHPMNARCDEASLGEKTKPNKGDISPKQQKKKPSTRTVSRAFCFDEKKIKHYK